MGGERSAGRRRGHPRSAAKCRETCAAFAEQNRTDQEHRQSSGEWAGWVAGPGGKCHFSCVGLWSKAGWQWCLGWWQRLVRSQV